MRTKRFLAIAAIVAGIAAPIAWKWPHASPFPTAGIPPKDERLSSDPLATPARPGPAAVLRENVPFSVRRSPESITCIQSQIEEATVQYSTDELPKFEEWLKDPDPVIRAAAADGLVRSGLAAGAGLLRSAAAASRDPQEIEKFLEGAAILELPPATSELVEMRRSAPKKPLRHFNMYEGSPNSHHAGEPRGQ